MKYLKQKKAKRALERGFLLVEMLVSIALFSIVIVVAVGALISVIEANRKAQSIKSVSNNLSFVLESMSRNIRMGRAYSCTAEYNPSSPVDCPTGGSAVTFVSQEGDTITYLYNANSERLERRIGLGSSFLPLTAPEVRITSAVFRVDGTSRSDTDQPRVIMNIKGEAGSLRGEVEFNIQSMASQRLVDFQQ